MAAKGGDKGRRQNNLVMEEPCSYECHQKREPRDQVQFSTNEVEVLKTMSHHSYQKVCESSTQLSPAFLPHTRNSITTAANSILLV